MYWFSVIYNIIVVLTTFGVLYFKYIYEISHKKKMPHTKSVLTVLAVMCSIGLVIFILARNSLI